MQVISEFLERLRDSEQVENLKQKALQWKKIAEEKLSEFSQLAIDKTQDWKEDVKDILKTWYVEVQPQLQEWQEELELLGDEAGQTAIELKSLIDEALQKWDQLQKDVGQNSCVDTTYNHNLQVQM